MVPRPEIKEKAKLIDIVIEIIDARIPKSSKIIDTEEFTIAAKLNSDSAVLVISPSEFINYRSVNVTSNFKPVIYLSSSVKISGGEGTISNPYELFL